MNYEAADVAVTQDALAAGPRASQLSRSSGQASAGPRASQLSRYSGQTSSVTNDNLSTPRASASLATPRVTIPEGTAIYRR